MKERPILFRTPMIQAILDGRKTVTRRAVNMPKENIKDATWGFTCFTPSGYISFRAKHENGEYGESFVKIPTGCKGTVLYVREMYYDYGLWEENGHTKTGRQKWKFVSLPSSADIRYCENPPEDVKPNSYRKLGWYKRLGRFMPYRYVRTKLEIVSIKVERLHDITEEDAIKEGVEFQEWEWGPMAFPDGTIDRGLVGKKTKSFKDYMIKDLWHMGACARQSFETLWRSINGKESWDLNPWVWRIEFKKL